MFEEWPGLSQEKVGPTVDKWAKDLTSVTGRREQLW